jgi:hypothetical protein
MAVGSLAKALGPLVASLLFAWSLDHDHDRRVVVDYHVTFFLIAFLTLATSIVSFTAIPHHFEPRSGNKAMVEQAGVAMEEEGDDDEAEVLEDRATV